MLGDPERLVSFFRFRRRHRGISLPWEIENKAGVKTACHTLLLMSSGYGTEVWSPKEIAPLISGQYHLFLQSGNITTHVPNCHVVKTN